MTSQRSSGNVGDVSDLPPQEQHLPDLVPEEAVKKARSNEIRVFFTSRFQGYWTRVTDQWGRELGASERKAAECYLTIKKCHTLAFLAPRQFIVRIASSSSAPSSTCHQGVFPGTLQHVFTVHSLH